MQSAQPRLTPFTEQELLDIYINNIESKAEKAAKTTNTFITVTDVPTSAPEVPTPITGVLYSVTLDSTPQSWFELRANVIAHLHIVDADCNIYHIPLAIVNSQNEISFASYQLDVLPDRNFCIEALLTNNDDQVREIGNQIADYFTTPKPFVPEYAQDLSNKQFYQDIENQ